MFFLSVLNRKLKSYRPLAEFILPSRFYLSTARRQEQTMPRSWMVCQTGLVCEVVPQRWIPFASILYFAVCVARKLNQSAGKASVCCSHMYLAPRLASWVRVSRTLGTRQNSTLRYHDSHSILCYWPNHNIFHTRMQLYIDGFCLQCFH